MAARSDTVAGNLKRQHATLVTYGLGLSGLAPGDKMFVLQDCLIPVVLRPIGERYLLIGEANIPAIVENDGLKETV
jgi:hypothetical protein